MKTTLSSNVPNLIVIAFGLTGLVWLGLFFTGQASAISIGLPLLNLLTAVLLLVLRNSHYARAFLSATSLYNFVVFAYQAYAAAFLLQLGLTSFAIPSLIVYAGTATLFALIGLASYSRADLIVRPRERAFEESRKNTS